MGTQASARWFRAEKTKAVMAGLVAAILGTLSLAVLVAPASEAQSTLPANCQPSGSQIVCTFNYTGAAQSWTVPDGVSQATFDVFGAQGRSVNDPGGLGGRVRATLSVTPGDAYRILVGGTFGFNGGGAPGDGASGDGPAGGGASDVRTGAYGLDDRLLVAGGGGGAGTLFENPGGDGGHPNGGAGVAPQGYRGEGGTQSAGGAGAFGAGNGSLGQGGKGANSADRGGGGGGGGYYGGGGGGTDGIVGFPGGGGSSYATPAATDVSFENGIRQGDGLVTITYTPNQAPTVGVAAGGDCKPEGGDAPAGTINLIVADAESDPADLTLSATSSNQAVVSEENISFGGTGAERTLGVRPTFAATRVDSTLTVEVSDGEDTASVPIEVQVGTRARDVLLGTANSDMIFARNGADSVSGRAANDLICGAPGDDALRGQGGEDTLRAAEGEDTLSGGVGADFFSGGPGTDTATDVDAAQGDRQTGIP